MAARIEAIEPVTQKTLTSKLHPFRKTDRVDRNARSRKKREETSSEFPLMAAYCHPAFSPKETPQLEGGESSTIRIIAE